MTTKLIFALIAGTLALVGNIPYLRDMFRRKIKPHPYTWLVWSIVSGVVLVGQIVKGAGFGIIPFAVSELFTITIFFFSLRYGFKKIPRKDTYFLIIALLGLIPWFITKDPTISVLVVVSIDAIAFIPTLIKAWRLPKTENPILYESNVARHSFALLSLSSYNIVTTLHSIVMIITNTWMTLILLRKKGK